jgi:hypothetical protein
MLLVLGLYEVLDDMINECGAVGGMRIGKRTHGGNYPQCHFVHKKFQIT